MDPRTLPLASILHIAKELILLLSNSPRLMDRLEDGMPYSTWGTLEVSRDPAKLQTLLSELNGRFAIDIEASDVAGDTPQSISALIDLVWTKLTT